MKRRLLSIPAALLSAAIILAGNAPHANALAGVAGPQTALASQKGGGPAPDAPVGTGIPYSGILLVGGVPANGPYDLTFTLYDALTGGTQVGTTLTSLNVTVTDGHYEALLDFGNLAFWGQARWIQIAYRPAGSGSYTTITPRRSVPVVPYAVTLSPGAVVTATTQSQPALTLINTGIGLSATGDSRGVYGNSNSGYGVYGYSSNGNGVYGNSPSGTGVEGVSNSGSAVKGSSTSGRGVYGVTASSSSSDGGVYGTSTGDNGIGVRGVVNTGATAKGVYGSSTNGYGVYGYSYDGEGVRGYGGGSAIGVRGISNNGTGVYGEGSFGVFGYSDNNTFGGAIYGLNNGGTASKAVVGENWDGYGVFGTTYSGYGVYGQVKTYGYGYAGYFQGKVHVNGTLSKSAGSFKIDHPMDPENKYLSHSFVESPDMMNVYNGNITTDATGTAIVTLPDYFEALNKDFRYQLTVMGQFAQAIVSDKVKNNRFTIKTDKPNVEVSWQVTGIRHDPYADKNRIPVEEDKPTNEKGTYLNPIEWGQPETKGFNYQEPLKAEPMPGAEAPIEP